MARLDRHVRRAAGAVTRTLVRRWGGGGAVANARTASTDLSRLRVEREEVEGYLAARAARRTA
jgi:hypothetical protein